MSEGCLLCGTALEYTDAAEDMQCSLCGRTFQSTARCKNGHYICDECHAAPAEAVVRSIALRTESKNPVEIADAMFASPAVHLHGPEHHFLVCAALLAAYKNAGGAVDLEPAVNAAIARGKKVPGGFCGLAGCCGAAVSVGIFASIVQKTTPLSEESWADGMRATAAALENIAEHGGPRCCKRDSYAAIQTAAAFSAKKRGISLSMPEKISCTHSQKNAECRKNRCPYYPL